ncbi:GNAT family N-acetyltransferase [Streptomyces antimycoticus]|uniref:GNAT family N-acetyltransferase n=1 Tax=Streptomyces antimycoticus TaxID=68175 RepID=A0ABD5JQU4_9ACTN|nr:GNAT family N-acetyltransferase [Streptomyces sp. DSM 41602]
MTQHDEQRQILTGPDGLPVLTYVQGTRDGHPWADLAEAVGPDPVSSILADMSGWAVSGSVELGEQLIQRGARIMRHAHSMHRDLITDPPQPEWSTISLPDGLRPAPCNRQATDVFPAWRAAFSFEHPDHYHGSDQQALDAELTPLLAGEVLGPVMPCSTLAVDEADQVIAGVIVTDRDGLPWIATVFRQPDSRYTGLGSVLLRRMLADAASHGLAEIALVVSNANPARRLYEKLGFQLTSTSLTVLVP